MKNKKEEPQCIGCSEGMDALAEKERESIEKFGWFTHFVFGDPSYPYDVNVHTHGIKENLKHEDFQVCLNMSPQVSNSIIWNAVHEIKKGFKFEAGKTYDNLIESRTDKKYEVLILNAKDGDRPVLRMIFPDKEGKFDGTLGKQLDGCEIPKELNLKTNQ